MIQVRPIGDEWGLLTASTDGVVQWLRVNHSGVVALIGVLPPVSSARPGSRMLSNFATHGSDVGFAWAQASKIDDLPSAEWERILGYATVNVESGAMERARSTTASRPRS